MRLIITSSILGSVLLSACVGPEGPPGPAGMNGGDGSASTTQTPDLFESGTRIKARTTVTEYSTPDGATRTLTGFAGWFDSQRNEPCSPLVAADGKTRCIPPASYAGGIYADANCTVPVVPVLGGGCMPEAPKYIALYPGATCPPSEFGPRLFAAGGVVTAYYTKGATACTGPTTVTSTTYVYYSASGAEIPPSTFAEMTVTSTTTP